MTILEYFNIFVRNYLYMTTKEIKSEIQKAIENVPDSILKEILSYLKQAQKTSLKDIKISTHLRQILREDKDLLEKLAQ